MDSLNFNLFGIILSIVLRNKSDEDLYFIIRNCSGLFSEEIVDDAIHKIFAPNNSKKLGITEEEIDYYYDFKSSFFNQDTIENLEEVFDCSPHEKRNINNDDYLEACTLLVKDLDKQGFELGIDYSFSNGVLLLTEETADKLGK
jgi:hypothetical protein